MLTKGVELQNKFHYKPFLLRLKNNLLHIEEIASASQMLSKMAQELETSLTKFTV